MAVELNPIEARVIGCLMEKSVVTPDQYPLTLNALTNACNQKSSRSPVMNLQPGEVQRAVRSLQDKHLLVCEENFKTQVEKYTHRLCNTPFSDYQFDAAEFAVVCVLLLRGPRTPGELRANVGRLHTFSDNDAVLETLQGLLNREGSAVVVQLPRSPGRKDSEYMHLLCGPVAEAEIQSGPIKHGSLSDMDPAPPPSAGFNKGNPADHEDPADREIEALKQRVNNLEQQLSDLKARFSGSIED